MIRCKICKKIAKVDEVWVNGLGETKVFGSCKHCGYTKQDTIEYDDFEELGVEVV